MKALLVCCAVLALFAPAVNAHEAHKKTQTQGSNTQPSQPEPSSTQPPPAEVQPQILEAEVPFPFSGPIQDHAHNKIVHFPLAFAIAGSLFVFISGKRPQMLP